MKKKYYYPVHTATKEVIYGFFKTDAQEIYDVIFDEWDNDAKSLLQNKPKIRSGSGINSIQRLRQSLDDAPNGEIRIYDAELGKVFTIHKRIEALEIDEHGRTKLHLAASSGDVSTMSDLIAADSRQINYQDTKGYTPLHYALARGHAAAVQMLIEHGASVEIGAWECENANRNTQPIQLLNKEEQGLPKLLHRKQFTSKQKRQLSELFPFTRDNNIRIVLKKNDTGKFRIIDKVIISNDSLHEDTLMQLETFYPTHDSQNMHHRHRVAKAWIVKQFQDNLIGRDYRIVFNEIRTALDNQNDHHAREKNTLGFAELLHDWFLFCTESFLHDREVDAPDSLNIFSGSSIGNLAKGWLLNELLKDDASKDGHFTVAIPQQFEEFFKKDCGCDLAYYVVNNSGTWSIQVDNMTDTLKLWQLAVVDDEDFLRKAQQSEADTNNSSMQEATTKLSSGSSPPQTKTDFISALICRFGHRDSKYVETPKQTDQRKKRSIEQNDEQSKRTKLTV